MKYITEIRKVSEQGVNHPFECVADDGYIYWCKGLQSGFQVLINEWIAGTIAQVLNLPIPTFDQLICDARLSDAWARVSANKNAFCERLSSPHMNVVFGSKGVPNVLDVRNASDVSRLADLKLQASIYLFDRVTQNIDRTCGNSNILFKTGQDEGVFIIDHSNAFSLNFDKSEFQRSHIFAGAWALCSERDKEDIISLFKETITHEVVETAWNSLPEVWLDESVSDKISLELIEGLVIQNLEAI